MLSKYQMAVAILCNLIFLAWALRHSRNALLRGVMLAALVSLTLLVPHMVWLVQNHFPTFAYASDSLGAALPPVARADSLLRFLASQTLRVMPAIVLLVVMQGLAKRQSSAPTSLPPQPESALAVPFWSIHAIGPLALMSLMSAVGGVDLEMHWGTAFLWALPMWYLSTARGRQVLRLPRGQLLVVLVLGQVMLMSGKLLLPDL